MARQREFEEEEVIDKVVQVFWRQGYEGTSLEDLLKATGLKKSSLYNAFRSKSDLYRLATQRYYAKYLGFQEAALAEKTPRGVAHALLMGTADLHTSPTTPPGCFETNGALACSKETEEIRESLLVNRNRLRKKLRDRFNALRNAGPVIGANSDDAAVFVLTLIQGMAVQAKGGASRKELRRFVDLSLAAWPEH
jgi:AcrR family transcriptional regulator